MARGTQAVHVAQQCALLVKRMAARGFALPGRKAVCELAAVVGQHGPDGHRRSALEAAQKVAAAELALVAIDAHVDPARGAVDGDKQIAPAPFIGHLRQVLDVNVNKTRLVVLEGFRRLLGLIVLLLQQRFEAAHPMAAQAAVKPRAGHRRVNELSRHHQQVIQRQQEQAPELDHDSLLGGRQHGAQLVRAVRAVFHAVPQVPFARCCHGDVVKLGQHLYWLCGRIDLSACSGRGAGLRMDAAHVVCSRWMDSITPCRTSLARKRGQLRVGI
ncbi:hypothetical protein VPARA_68440 [Variovorax paradoxus]|uniref:Uncharacterized protein n=1 Tax=Variovorax paradoxus TaxID=34073 RepID=A0A0H2LNZ2_VARPD|nr:hypothetical protein VPARA_68440 [Variovorax paradoxus]